jgi:SAM-dependent methyltransferase
MADTSFGPLRIWDGSLSGLARGPGPPSGGLSDEFPAGLEQLAEQIAAQEALRAPGTAAREPVEVMSLQWYQDVQSVRHSRQGRWIPHLLEFSRHGGERLLGLGGGLGSDLVEYARHGAEVVAACPCGEQLAILRRHFELRGQRGVFLHASPRALPLEPSSIDVVCLTGVVHDEPEPAALIDEIYRVLKPGGKVLAVLPAHYDVDYWRRYLALGDHRMETAPGVPAGLLARGGQRYRSRDLRQLFHRFSEPRTYKRHLRRSEVPHVWRWLPLALLERLMGRLLIFKGFKPVSSAIAEQAAA